ncbi:MAG: signal peptidase I [Acholeplasmatales bacterium]|nr:signal peptidase I [Acholeplasmatales bacterium]
MTKTKKKIKTKTLIGYIVSIFCLLLCLYITVEVIVASNQNRPPRVFNISVTYVPTESMEPTISSNSYIMFYGASFDDVKVKDSNNEGDIIIYYSNKNDFYIVHRAIGRGIDENGNKYLICKGDNNTIEDAEHVYPAMVYGKYITTIGFMSIFTGGVNTSAVFVILIIIFIIMVAMQVTSMVISVKKEKLKESKKEEENRLREELKAQILKEELEKLRNQKAVDSNQDNSISDENEDKIDS